MLWDGGGNPMYGPTFYSHEHYDAAMGLLQSIPWNTQIQTFECDGPLLRVMCNAQCSPWLHRFGARKIERILQDYPDVRFVACLCNSTIHLAQKIKGVSFVPMHLTTGELLNLMK